MAKKLYEFLTLAFTGNARTDRVCRLKGLIIIAIIAIIAKDSVTTVRVVDNQGTFHGQKLYEFLNRIMLNLNRIVLLCK